MEIYRLGNQPRFWYQIAPSSPFLRAYLLPALKNRHIERGRVFLLVGSELVSNSSQDLLEANSVRGLRTFGYE